MPAAKLTRNQQAAGICLILALVTAALYWPMLHHDFISYYDDDAYITGNPHVNAGLTWAGVVWAFQSGYAANWHPLTWISHMLDCQLYGLNPWGHHLTNLLFHVANTLLLFLWLHRLTGALWRSAFVAAMFAWHPLHVESVAWAAERKDVLSAFFWMLTLMAYARYVSGARQKMSKREGGDGNIQHPTSNNQRSMATHTAPGAPAPAVPKLPSEGWSGPAGVEFFQKRAGLEIGAPRLPSDSGAVPGCSQHPMPGIAAHTPRYYCLALLFFACGLMSKPMVVTLPFVLLLLDFWPLKRFSRFTFHVSHSVTTATASVARLIFEKLPFFALALAGSVITYSVQQAGGAFWLPNVLPLHLRLANAVIVYVRYISKLFWPADLALIYPYPHHWHAGLVLGAALLLVMWSGLFLWRARQNPYLAVGWFWYLGTLAPTIGLVQVGVQSMADRYTYLPSVGLFILVAWSLNEWVNFRPPWRKPAILVCATALAGCLAATEIQLCFWQNSLTLLTHTVDVTTGNYAAYNCLGNALEKAGRKDDALRLYAESVRVQPDFPAGQFNLGMLLLESGRPQEASNHLAIAAQLMPHKPEVQYDFGLFLLQHDRPEEAVRRFEAALREKPDFSEARHALDQALAKSKTTAPPPANRSTP